MINIIKLLKKNKYKFFVIFVILFLFIFYGLWSIVSGGYDKQNKAILLLKNFIPTKLARQVRDTVFIIPDLKQRNKFLELVMRKYDQNLNGEIFNEEILKSKKNGDKYLLREFFLPFPRLDTRLGWASTKNTLRKHYFEIVKNRVLVISGNGQTIYFNKENIFNNRLNQINISNNIQEIVNQNNFENMGIRDLFVDDNKVYISLYFKNLEGYSVNIYHADLNFNDLKFELLFESNEFWKKYTVRTGGRIEKYKKDKILLSIGDGSTKDAPQNLDSLLGKIISIDKKTGKHKIISIGHRNPQGLFYEKDLNIIINAEHGPKGGDEININFQKIDDIPNYGWDVASYGTEYSGNDPYKKSHTKYGFIEPLKYYDPSIGISQIALINNKSNLNGEKYLLVSSLRAESIYLISINKNLTKILNEDRIFFSQRRIRDIEYDEENRMLFLLFENIPSIGILELKM